jgi:hypothetical protein
MFDRPLLNSCHAVATDLKANHAPTKRLVQHLGAGRVVAEICNNPKAITEIEPCRVADAPSRNRDKPLARPAPVLQLRLDNYLCLFHELIEAPAGNRGPGSHLRPPLPRNGTPTHGVQRYFNDRTRKRFRLKLIAPPRASDKIKPLGRSVACGTTRYGLIRCFFAVFSADGPFGDLA